MSIAVVSAANHLPNGCTSQKGPTGANHVPPTHSLLKSKRGPWQVPIELPLGKSVQLAWQRFTRFTSYARFARHASRGQTWFSVFKVVQTELGSWFWASVFCYGACQKTPHTIRTLFCFAEPPERWLAPFQGARLTSWLAPFQGARSTRFGFRGYRRAQPTANSFKPLPG